jgi:hypothetical protein
VSVRVCQLCIRFCQDILIERPGSVSCSSDYVLVKKKVNPSKTLRRFVLCMLIEGKAHPTTGHEDPDRE